MGELANINRGRPFKNKAKEYLKKGMHPIPLPSGQKFPPPTGWTGRSAPAVTFSQIDEWLSESDARGGNLGVHMYDVILPDGSPKMIPDPSGDGGEDSSPALVPATLIGIDVDHYDDKTGGDTLRRLERKFGELPPTWTSSSRDDGVSGIRYYLAPASMEYMGKVGDSIECIQKKHRFAVVYPSWHPKGGQYVWYPPGCAPRGVPTEYTPPGTVTHSISETGSGSDTVVEFRFRRESLVSGESLDSDGVGAGGSSTAVLVNDGMTIPNAWDMPVLPPRWVEYLTQGYQLDSGATAIDMETSVDDIYKWARKHFKQKGGSRKSTLETAQEELLELGCSQMRKRAEILVDSILASDDTHDLLRNAHWEIFRMGAEGHGGWMAASRVVEHAFLERVMGGAGKAQKRGLQEASSEMFRSRTNGLRKIKAQFDRQAKESASASGDSPSGSRVRFSNKCSCYEGDRDIDLGEFGELPNASLLDPDKYEMNDDGNGEHFNDLFSEKFYYVIEHGQWIYWDGKRWLWDEGGLTRRAWRVVKKRQRAYADQLMSAAIQAKMADMPEAKELLNEAKRWFRHANASGNNAQANGALEAASHNVGVAIPSSQIDGDEHLLGVENGVIELNPGGIHFRQAKKEDWVVTNTRVPYVRRADLLQAGGEYRRAVELWDLYLDTFLPDPVFRKWVQTVMGMCLYGRNQEKKLIFLYGDTNTGKTTMLDAVMHALGDYAGSGEMSMFEATKLNPALAQMLPRRIFTTSEAGAAGKKLTADMFKRITGDDPMSAELKGVNKIITRIPAFTPILATNTAPQIDHMDEALRLRTIVLSFENRVDSFPEGGAVKDETAPAVLAWLLEGWVMYSATGLSEAPDSTEVRARFEQDMLGDLGDFFEECLVITGSADDYVSAHDVHSAYSKWASRNGYRDILPGPVFGKRMSKIGHKAKPRRTEDGKQLRFYSGIKLTKSVNNIVKKKFGNDGA